MIFLLYGDDSLSVEETLASLRPSADSDDGLYDVNTSTLNGASVGFAELEAAWSTIPFMADKHGDSTQPDGAQWSREGRRGSPSRRRWKESGQTLGSDFQCAGSTDLIFRWTFSQSRNSSSVIRPLAHVHEFVCRRARHPAGCDSAPTRGQGVGAGARYPLVASIQ